MKIKLTIFYLLISISGIGQNSPIELYQTGNSNFKSGNFEKAIENYTELMKIIDDSTAQKTCYINRGLSYDKLQNTTMLLTTTAIIE